MSTILPQYEDLDKHDLKVAILEQFSLAYRYGLYHGPAFRVALSTPTVKEFFSEGVVEKFVKDICEGKPGHEIFGEMGLFNEFELGLIKHAFDNGSIDKIFKDLAEHLKEYTVRRSAF